MKTPLPIEGGWLDGRMIRRARKPFHCRYWHGRANGGHCKTIVQPGELYAEGESNDVAGGYGVDRYCIACAGDEVRATIEKAA
jgi:hypothetical protein